MRRLSIAFLLAFSWTWRASAQTYAGNHNASVYNGSQSNPNNLTLSGTTASGDVIAFVGAIADNKGISMDTPTDSESNTYTQCGTTQDNTSGHIEEGLWLAVNGTSASVTVHQNLSNTFSGFAGQWAASFSGVSPSVQCDGFAGISSGTVSGTTWTTTDLTTTYVNAMMFGQCVSSGTDTPNGSSGTPTTTNIDVGEPYVDGYVALTMKYSTALYSTTVGASADYVCLVVDMPSATQPASTFMVPFVAQILNRFWPGYLHLYPQGK